MLSLSKYRSAECSTNPTKNSLYFLRFLLSYNLYYVKYSWKKCNATIKID